MRQGKDLNLRDLEVMHSQEVKHETYPETMEKLDISRDTVARTKRKQAYRDIVIASLEERGTTPDKFAENLIALMEAKKEIYVKNEGLVEVDDNTTRFNAVKKHGDILGVDAPKEFDLKHSMAAMSDDELSEAIDESVKELGSVQHSITSTPTAKANITSTIVNKEPAVVEHTREQTICPTDS